MTVASIIELFGGGRPIRYACTDDTNISKGTILELHDARKVSGTTALMSGSMVAGIAAMEKKANDGSTSISVYTDGIFDISATGGAVIIAGQGVIISGANAIQGGTGLNDSGAILGRALEETAAGVTETIAVRVNL